MDRHYVTIALDARMPKKEAAQLVFSILRDAIADRDIAAEIACVDIHDADEDLVLEHALSIAMTHGANLSGNPNYLAILNKLAEHVRERRQTLHKKATLP